MAMLSDMDVSQHSILHLGIQLWKRTHDIIESGSMVHNMTNTEHAFLICGNLQQGLITSLAHPLGNSSNDRR